MKKDRQRKVQEKLVGIIFILTLFLFLIINVIVPDREKSVQENRMLATRPKFRLSSLISGDYDEKFEAYMDDQFVGRDMWRKLKVTVDRIGGSRLENGVYIGTNGQLLEQIEVADENHLAANIKAIKSFSESQSKIPVRMMLVPDAANVLNHSLPSLAKPEDQTQMFSMVRKDLGDSVEWIDVSTELNKHKTEKIYYKTDLHYLAAQFFDQLDNCLGSTAGSDQVINDNNLLSRSNGVLVHLNLCSAIFQCILCRNSLARQFSFFADRNKALVLCIGNRHTKDKSSGLRTYYYIIIYIL